VWLALEHKGIAYELKILSFAAGDTTKPEFVAINPRHVVPTIVEEDGFALWESIPILEYLDEKYPAGAKLYPGDARARARIRRLIREAEEHLGVQAIDVITDEYFGKGGAEPDAEKVGKARDKLREELGYFAKELKGSFFGGEQLDALDLGVLYPWYGYVKRITFRKPETKLTDLVPPAMKAWAERIEAWPFFDKTFPAHWR